MSGVMTQQTWAKYINAINPYSDSVSEQPITWNHMVSNVDRWQEGMTKEYEVRNMVSLVAYNTFRTWPVDIRTDTGIIDKEYCHLYLNMQYLRDNGWLTPNEAFDFNPDYDRFIINGQEYKPAGDTGTAQANIAPVFYILILEREESDTGNKARR